MIDFEHGRGVGRAPSEQGDRAGTDGGQRSDRRSATLRTDGGAVAETEPTSVDPDAPGDDAPATITPETVFEVLSNERRRYVLNHLKSAGERVTVRDLSEQVAAWENEVDRKEVTAKERKRVYTALHQTHLPKMAKVGVIDYDRDRGTLALTDAIAAFDIYLEIVPERELSWGELYLALGIFSTTLVAVAALDIYPFSLLPDIAYALVVALGWLVTAAVHTYVRRAELLGGGDPTELSRSLRPPE